MEAVCRGGRGRGGQGTAGEKAARSPRYSLLPAFGYLLRMAVPCMLLSSARCWWVLSPHEDRCASGEQMWAWQMLGTQHCRVAPGSLASTPPQQCLAQCSIPALACPPHGPRLTKALRHKVKTAKARGWYELQRLETSQLVVSLNICSENKFIYTAGNNKLLKTSIFLFLK